MATLPRGTVTLLFTDIEGSTRLLQELGRDRYVRALGDHRRLLRDAFTRHGGVEVEMQGDSFHYAFIQARDAVAAARDAQLQLAAHAWETEPIRVRIGIHTGEPVIVDNLFAGIDVHRASRTMSAGHGGQVLLSDTTRALVEAELSDGLALRDLGDHRLKDLVHPQRLWQLVIAELPGEFPPLKTIDASPDGTSEPAPVAAGPVDDRTAGAQERKVVTVLVCELAGSPADADDRDPEDLQSCTNGVNDGLRHEIEAFGGTIETVIGDTVVAVFGVPQAHEDDAERAVRAALRIVETTETPGGDDGGQRLLARIGIGTGPAIVSRERAGSEPRVVGDVVRRAARVQAAMSVDGVVVDRETHVRTARALLYEDLGAVAVKGSAEPMPLWRATAPRARVGTDVTRSHTTPFVGRDVERQLLAGAYERAAHDSSVQLVTVVGEPGVGKSRLVAELYAHVDAQPTLVRWRHGRCLPYGDGIAFGALSEIVKAEAGILESDSGEAAAEKLEAAVPADEPDREWLKARLAPLIGGDSGQAVEREEAFLAWRRFLEGIAATGPAVVVFEDLHWADAALVAFLEHLTDWAEGVPLLLVCTARPELYERYPTWAGGRRNTTTVNLAPLSDPETSTLVSALLDAAVLPDDVHALLLERAGGNPLYAEEFVRMLVDRDLLVLDDGALRLAAGAEVPFPEGIQALIAARLDTLSPVRKALLQDAAVVGKVFWVGAVTAMAGRDERLVREALHELSRRELVRSARLSSMAGHAEYAFWHVLVRDVAYAEVPRAARGRKHRAAAEWLESQASERVEDVADVLAHHYLQALALDGGEGAERAELESRALRFLLAAGDRALGLDVAQAEAHYARALELAPPGHAEHLAALARRLEALRQAGRYAAALELVEEAVAAAGDGDADLPLLRLEQGWTLSVAGRVQQAVGALRAGLDAADGRRDGVVAQLLLQLARARTIQGEFEAGLEDALAAERIFAEHDDLRGLSRAARLAGDVYRKLGRWDDAAATLLRGLALAERVGSVEEVGGCLMNLSLVEHERGALDDAIEYCRKAVAEFERVGHGSGRAQGYANLAQLLADAGHDQEALLLCERSQRVARTIGHSLSIADTTDTMASLALRAGDPVAAAARAEEAAALYLDIGAAPQAAQALRTAAAAWEQRGETDRAAECLERADTVAPRREAAAGARVS